MSEFIKKLGFNKTRSFYFVNIPKKLAGELKQDCYYRIVLTEVKPTEEEVKVA